MGTHQANASPAFHLPPMIELDSSTLLLVNALFGVLAVGVWLVLAFPFRIARRACLLLAMAQTVMLPTLVAGPGPFRELSGICLLVALGLLSLSLRQLLRLRQQRLDLLGLLALGLLADLARLSGLPAPISMALTALCMAALALLAGRDLLLGSLGLDGWLRGGLVAPYAAMTTYLMLRAIALMEPEQAPQWLLQDPRQHAGLAAAWLVLAMAISGGLVALVLSRLIQRIEALTRHDPLTGLFNRRELREQLARQQARAQRGHVHALLMLDLDHFKRINDELGHAAGDAALCHVARLLRAAVREQDCPARYGGEEFALLLPDTTLAGAMVLAERLREALATSVWSWHGRHWSLTASFGLALSSAAPPSRGRVPPASASELLVGEALVDAADRAMYMAKSKGRNQVCLAPLPGSAPC
ncbi:GGDEF domain-containing protein [Pelomonas sp. APW6]|uniref:diguanylate cyclase n=1 Tax=Roseateles subflavus TaxID=3053353 RepID=A0ABT7LBQ0_9BURK|nr:GGDEF domain-containing protein [Pelomonas sp. APW6]MDL5030288.1 GGDEF domain-containing protein [Pelomonas sp. APW6]